MTKEKKKPSCLEWLQLLITFSIPVILAVYTVLQDNRDISIASHNRQQDLDIVDDQEKDTILHECQKTLSKLIEKYGIRFNEQQTVSLAARFVTLSTLNQLDPIRRSFLIHLLYEARLITYELPNKHTAISLQSANLTDINLNLILHSKSLKYISFKGALMIRANFREINIHGIKFDKAILNNADFSLTSNSWECQEEEDCDMTNKQKLSFDNTNLKSSSFYHTTYEMVSFNYANMIDCNLKLFFCTYCSFISTNLTRANLQMSGIDDSSFLFSNLNHVNFYQSTIGPNVNLDNVDMKLIQGKNIQLKNCQLNQCNLCESIFDYSIIINSTFKETKMIKISMQYSYIINGKFFMVNLYGANWQYIKCEKCIFNDVNLTDVNFFNTIFIESHFQNCYLTEKQLKQATFLNSTIQFNSTVFPSK